jgi:hypothetical protein
VDWASAGEMERRMAAARRVKVPTLSQKAREGWGTRDFCCAILWGMKCTLSPFSLAAIGGNLSLYLCLHKVRADSKLSEIIALKEGSRVQTISCLRCRREIETGDKSVAVYMFAQTVGVRPRQKSGAQRICFCPQCAVSLAMGMPPEGALNMAAWDMIRDLVSSEPSLNEAAWESLRGVVGLLGTGEEDSRTKYRRAG